MAKYEGSVPYTGFIAPADDTDTFNVTDERFNKGGYRSVINQIERLAITPERRKEGMLVKQLDTGEYWTLEGGITNNDWVEPEFATSVIADRLYQPDGTNAFVYTDNSGNLHIDGNIIQNGASYETHAEKLYTTKDFIITRENAVSALAVGALSGIQVTKYDGLNDLIFGTDKNGFFKIGEPSNLQTVGTRQDSPIAKGLGYYNEALYRWDTTAHMKFNTTSNNLEVSGIKLGTLSGLLNATEGVIGTITLKTINSQSVIGSGNIVINSEDLRWDGESTGLDAATGRTSLGLGTAATKNVGTGAGNVMEVGAFGIGKFSSVDTIGDNIDIRTLASGVYSLNKTHFQNIADDGAVLWVGMRVDSSSTFILQRASNYKMWMSTKYTNQVGVINWVEIYHTGNLVNPVTGTGSAGRVAFWDSANGLTSNANFLFDSGTLRFANGMGGRGVEISNSGIQFKASGAGGWAMQIGALDQSNSGIGNIVGGFGEANSISYAYLGGTGYDSAALYAHSDKSVSINKTSVTSGYKLDVNGATAMTGLKVGTLSGLTRMNGGVMEAASITISTSEPSTSGRLNGDIWVKL